MFKRYRFRGLFEKRLGNCAEAQLKSASETIYHIHRSLSRKLSSKKFLLLSCQILGLLVNTLVIDEKDPVHNRENLTILIQTELSQKQKTFSQSFSVFSKFKLNFKIFE